MMQRRNFMGAVAGLAATRWDAEDYDVEDAEKWEAVSHGVFSTGAFEPATVRASGNTAVTSWCLEDDDLDEATAEVTYTRNGVSIVLDGSGGDRYTGATATFDAADAKELAAALYQAAEEQARRPWEDE